ncbi:hypothetical protein O181_084446 [Austropuccinia psidii MF-1]|uniref:Uncharacterized protein n=1 Tax=Austropuccinia psidii MF-1 TaxID=1389203 RepID=A0A9Q3FWJ5_9BASI|nr:hypothetical protein [Austropuccinia psidii MF-1]
MSNGKTLREIMPTLSFTFQFNIDHKSEDCTDIYQVPQPHKLLKDLFQWIRQNTRFNVASHWEELEANFHKICFREMCFKDVVEITKGWNPKGKLNLLEERAARIRENKVKIRAI